MSTPTTAAGSGPSLAELGEWEPSPQRIDPLELIAADEHDRLADLVPLRHRRMAESPFAFFRATASVQAADMAEMPRTSLVAQLSRATPTCRTSVSSGPRTERSCST